ncbi:dolichyl-phosphate beta-glucosyltransferase [Pieris brassicae]|uniref:Dolichyl-phosphate beta-glucosyltransferase n=1 Tax=Pieris brassicae TaxID=7116 RepID=A0A9P0XF00_PIEBR|nr:dolichyl-phosphate beta-glucosyltransferase [Pieris brassicae]XP_045520113.1 dolichyl-phosphate beta-glucosyltransferase [Pieris brassicae]CAH4036106.1 unnamed protein product [Pieris brassicae]
MGVFSHLYFVFVYAAITTLASFVAVVILLLKFTKPYPTVERFKEEETFNDPQTKSRKRFYQLEQSPVVHLSVIVPAYNEEERLPPMLDEAIEFLEKRTQEQPSYKYEIIVVSDGSKDNTVNVAEKYVEKYGCEKIRCLELIKNRGKGGAVKLGILSCRGSSILFADADGASKFEDLNKLETALNELLKCNSTTELELTSNSLAVVIGSRAHLEKESLAKRSLFRNILMYGFHFLVWFFTVKGIKDTQCGFKLFTRQAARNCFGSLHVNRWAFDVELLYIAQKLNIPIVEIPVRWTEIDGSKVTPVLSWIQMGCDLAIIWLKYKIGAWKMKRA